MLKKAYDIVGMVPADETQVTIQAFRHMLRQRPQCTLDEAILAFEYAAPYHTLESFATSKQRTADGYRRRFGPLFQAVIQNQ